MTLSRLIISTALAVLSLVSAVQAQEVLYLDRSSFGKAVLSQTESTVGDIQLELSVGDYKNEPIINYSDRSELVQFGRSVGRLDVLYDKGISSCTAFIVSKQYILTNYHCSLGILENARINASRIDAINFVAGYTQTGIEENTRKYTVIPTPVESSKELDYAVLEVVGDPSQEYGELKLASLAPQSGDPFWIIGHPMGEGQRVSREKCRASSPPVSAGKLLHTCDTLPGNSGSPVIDVSLRQVVALHHAGSQKDSVNFAILMSEILENSTVLAAYKAPEATPKSQPVEPKTAANSACDALYGEAKEAKACYAYGVYINSCPAHKLAPMARGYINEFCKPQETVKVDKVPAKTCDDDPSLCSTDQLCGQSIDFKSGKAAWRTDNVFYVGEAKRKGLSCGVLQDSEVTNKALIKAVQKELNRIGCNTGYPDGIIGKKTENAVKVFTKKADIEFKGIAWKTSDFLKVLLPRLKRENSKKYCPVNKPKPVTPALMPSIILGIGTVDIASQHDNDEMRRAKIASLKAIREATRDLTVKVHSLKVNSRTTVLDAMNQSATLRHIVEATIERARGLKSRRVGKNWEVVVKLNQDMITLIMEAARKTQ